MLRRFVLVIAGGRYAPSSVIALLDEDDFPAMSDVRDGEDGDYSSLLELCPAGKRTNE